MIWMFLMQCLMTVSAYLLLKQKRVRNHLVGAAALAWSISLKTANVLFMFALCSLAGLAVVSLAFALGLIFRAWGWTDFGNGVITFTFTLTALALGIAALAIGAISNAAAKAITSARSTISSAGAQKRSSELAEEGLEKAIEQLKAQFPKQLGLLNAIQASIGSWVSALFSFEAVRGLLAIPHTLLLDTAEGVAKAVNQMSMGVLAALLWMFIAGFVAMWIPESTNAFWIIVIPYGLLTLLGIGAYKGAEWCEKHRLPDLWWSGYRVVRLGVRTAIVAVVVGAMYAALQPTLPHWFTGARNNFLLAEESVAKEHFGPRFDQRVFQVVDPGYAYYQVGGQTRHQLLAKSTVLWKTSREPFEYKAGVQYAEYALQVSEGLVEPSDFRVLFPESKVREQRHLALVTVQLDSGTVYRPDSSGVASDRLLAIPSFMTAEMTNITGYVMGVQYVLCRTDDRGRTYKIWVRQADINAL